ncbi:hypothetical protein PoHVEF18_006165 [Penicillium ochrochloron]
MAIALAEADKYEILEKIGCGSFGIIRKVKRKSDGFVSGSMLSQAPGAGHN